MQGLLHGLNTNRPPISQHLQILALLQPTVNTIIDSLRGKYHNQPLPLDNQLRVQANLSRTLIEEMTAGYKCILVDLSQNTSGKGLRNEAFLATLRQSIVQLGQQLLECYIQYRREPTAIWGELHQLYRFAESNRLNKLPLKTSASGQQPRDTIQQAYTRVVLLSLTQPLHLLSGQAEMIYDYLEEWTTDVHLEERMDTLADTGDMLVDLASNQPPIIATSHTRFRPIDGRYLDISQLKKRLQQTLDKLEPETAQILPLAKRIFQDMLSRLCKAWAGRGDRASERADDGNTPVLASIGLEAAHYYVSGEKEFLPENDETQWKNANRHQPGNNFEDQELTISPRNTLQAGEENLSPANPNASGFITMGDAWSTHLYIDLPAQQQYIDLPVQQQKEDRKADYSVEPWRRINHSEGGLALSWHANSRIKMYIGSLLAFRDDKENLSWRIGVIRWLKNKGSDNFEIGIQALANYSRAVAVRALVGTGNGGNYFRSLIIGPLPSTGEPQALVVPANIFAPETQLMLNRDAEISYIRLTRIIETSGRFSIFAFEETDEPIITSGKPSRRTGIITD